MFLRPLGVLFGLLRGSLGGLLEHLRVIFGRVGAKLGWFWATVGAL